MTPKFLGVDSVLRIHEVSIEMFRGAGGVREPGLLDSAVAQPRATYGRDYLHDDLFAMAPAYLFHIVKNHPFVDGNKRTGLAADLSFLDVNGLSVDTPNAELYDATIAVAEARLDKPGLAEILRRLGGG